MKLSKHVLLVAAILSMSACAQKGDTGLTGAPGLTGPQGNDGATGPAGADGTVVSAVQFCPGDTPSYPSVFPEVGICLNGSIYAVYSANGGFLTKVTDGLYNSNAVGSTCNFQVSGCTVTPQ